MKTNGELRRLQQKRRGNGVRVTMRTAEGKELKNLGGREQV